MGGRERGERRKEKKQVSMLKEPQGLKGQHGKQNTQKRTTLRYQIRFISQILQQSMALLCKCQQKKNYHTKALT